MVFTAEGPVQGHAKILRCMIVCKSDVIKVNILFMVGKIVTEVETGAFYFSWA